MAKSAKLIVHASQVLTGAGIRKRDGRRIQDGDIDAIPDGAIVFRDGKIEWVGPTDGIPKKYARLPKRDLRGKHAVVPGLIDCHTHLVFAGDRAEEFALRCGGVSYEEIAKRGGGIANTVRSTRQASPKELEQLAIPRVREALALGVRTLEVKSGYGLDHATEIKCLEVVQKLRKLFPEMTFVSTYLGAHAFPPGRDPEDYIAEMLSDTLPEIAKRKLADACDVFIDRGYYSVAQGQRILSHAKDLGLQIKVHADELANTESAALAARMGALSADHLLKISESGIQALGRSQTTAVLLPGTAFYLKAEHAPARKLIEAGARVAISTDYNPGTCVTLHLPTILTISALYLGMTRAELFASVTYNAARALGLHKRKGTIEEGMDADFTVLPFARFEELYYRFGWLPPATLTKK